ncbi:alpha-amylase family glycosyl hydrolase [Alkalibacterium putridalgicola]|uniref:alpha-amylase family glycosyl hydrolase n=1 Tax=Alkalibacterium putridalgicola TaxID=426703 RepID=UPI0034CECE74
MNKQWWNETVFYQIYIPSFRDGNQDGIGDFKGITEKLSHLEELGVKGVWLTPFYPSPKIDNGYDISDYTAVDPQYGTMEDFECFIQEAKKRDIKVIIDIVINHTSTNHEWFQESKSSISSSKRDWYIWKDKPNNWESYFGGSAWEYDETTKQYYYHSFAKEQADLNWSNSEVKREIYKMLEFWLGKGVDGFRLDVINNLTVELNFEDNPYDSQEEQLHSYDKDQEGLDAVLSDLVTHIKSINSDVLLVGEISSDDLDFISHYAQDGLFDLTFNFNIGSLEKLDLSVFFSELNKMNEFYIGEKIPTLFFGSHDLKRSWDRLAANHLNTYKMLLTFLLLAKGVPFIYFGEEFGMRNSVPEKLSDFRDVQGLNAYYDAISKGKSESEALKKAQRNTRDGGRTPMSWDDEQESDKQYWIKKSEDNPFKMVIMDFYKKMIKIRADLDLGSSDYNLFETAKGSLVFQRKNIRVYLHFGEKMRTFPCSTKYFHVLSETGDVIIENDQIKLSSYSSVVIKLNERE